MSTDNISTDNMSTDNASTDNIALVRRYTEEGCVGGSPTVIDEIVSGDAIDHDPLPGQPPSRQGLRRAVEMVTAGLSERHMVFDEYLAVGDRVVQNWIFAGTHTGDLLGIPPTGRQVRIRGMEIWRVAGGRIVERWGVVDVAGALAQLDAAPVA